METLIKCKRGMVSIFPKKNVIIFSDISVEVTTNRTTITVPTEVVTQLSWNPEFKMAIILHQEVDETLPNHCNMLFRSLGKLSTPGGEVMTTNCLRTEMSVTKRLVLLVGFYSYLQAIVL